METNPNDSREAAAPEPARAEESAANLGQRLNWLRAGVLGANDGIVSISGIVIGVAAAGAGHAAVLTAGLAGLAAGAMSMAAGEYVSVSTQRDTEAALIAQERYELEHFPQAELEELASFYQAKGLSPQLARTVAEELTAHDALAAHAEVELKIDHEDLTNPWHAAAASMIAFVTGSILPLVAIMCATGTYRIPITVAAAAASMALTGWISARLGHSKAWVAIARNVVGGSFAMAVTYGIGSVVGNYLG